MTEQHLATIDTASYVDRYRDEERFIGYCRDCRNYGSSWTCPPFNIDTGTLICRYRHTLIIVTRLIPAVPDRLPDDIPAAVHGMIHDCRRTLDPRLLELERKYGGLAFFAGNCRLCYPAPCRRTLGEQCLHSLTARPSLESFGFDLMRTAQDLCSVEMRWSDGSALPPYITLVSGFMHNSENVITW